MATRPESAISTAALLLKRKRTGVRDAIDALPHIWAARPLDALIGRERLSKWERGGPPDATRRIWARIVPDRYLGADSLDIETVRAQIAE